MINLKQNFQVHSFSGRDNNQQKRLVLVVIFLYIAAIIFFSIGSTLINTRSADGYPYYSPTEGAYQPSGQYGGYVAGQNWLSFPSGVAIDTSDHLLFVADQGNNRVLVYKLSSTDQILSHTASYVLGQTDFINDACANNPATQAGMCNPEGLAYDPNSNLLFVADVDNNRVLAYDLSGGITNGMDASYVLGQTDFSGFSNATTQNGMYYPNRIAYDSADNYLFVSDTQNSRVLVFDLSGGITDGMNATHVLGQTDYMSMGGATTQDGMYFPAGLTYNAADKNLYVTDSLNNRVLVFDLSGGITDGMNATHVLGQTDYMSGNPATTQNGLSDPSDVVYDSGGSQLFVVDSANKRVLDYDLSSGITDGMPASYVLGQSGFMTSAVGLGADNYNEPAAETFDPTTNQLLVVDEENARVDTFSLNSGVSNGMDPSSILDGNLDFGDASSIQIDPTNHRLFVGSGDYVAIYALDSSNNLSSQVPINILGSPDFVTSDAYGNGQNGIGYVSGMTYDPANEELFVSDSSLSRVLVFDLSGGITNGMPASYVLGQTDFSGTNSNTTQNGLYYPAGLSYNTADNQLFVADEENSRVLVFDLGGGIVDGMNATYVLGQSDFMTPGPNTTQSGFSYPEGVDYDASAKRLFVADSGNDRVLVFDLSSGIIDNMTASYVLGQSDFTSDGSGSLPNQLYAPAGVLYDPASSQLFVGDANNYRALVFDLSSGITDDMSATGELGQSYFGGADDYGVDDASGLAYDPTNNRLWLSGYYDDPASYDFARLTDNIAAATVGTNYSQSLTVYTQGTPSYSVISGALPPGVSLNYSGDLVGVPTEAGTYNFTIKLTDSVRSDGSFSGSESYSLTVSPGGSQTNGNNGSSSGTSHKNSSSDNTNSGSNNSVSSSGSPIDLNSSAGFNTSSSINNASVVNNIASGQVLNFTLKDNNGPTVSHSITVDSITPNTVGLTLDPNSFFIVLASEEKTSLDANNVGVDDLGMQLNSIDGSTASMKFWKILPAVEAAAAQPTTNTITKFIAKTSKASYWIFAAEITLLIAELILMWHITNLIRTQRNSKSQSLI